VRNYEGEKGATIFKRVILGGLTVVRKRGRVRGNDQHTKAMEKKPESRKGTANERAGQLLLARENTMCGTPFRPCKVP